MKTISDFYKTLPVDHPIHTARHEYARLSSIFEHEGTNGEEIPDLLAATTRLRTELEEIASAPPIVKDFAGMLDSEVRFIRSIIGALKGAK